MPKNLTQPQLDLEAAVHIAEQFTIIPGFPDTDGAIRAVAEWLLDHCSREQAQALVRKAVRTWGGTWTGLWDLEKMYNPSPGLLEFVPYDKPAVCEACNNTGVFGETAGGYVRCSCEYGRKTGDEYLQALNRPKRFEPVKPPPLQRITQADVDRARKRCASSTAARSPPK